LPSARCPKAFGQAPASCLINAATGSALGRTRAHDQQHRLFGALDAGAQQPGQLFQLATASEEHLMILDVERSQSRRLPCARAQATS
jgi:hypothetical protein